MDRSIDFQFCSSPVSTFSIVSNFVIGFITEPVGKRTILSLRLGQSFLHEKSFMGSHMWCQNIIIKIYQTQYLQYFSQVELQYKLINSFSKICLFQYFRQNAIYSINIFSRLPQICHCIQRPTQSICSKQSSLGIFLYNGLSQAYQFITVFLKNTKYLHPIQSPDLHNKFLVLFYCFMKMHYPHFSQNQAQTQSDLGYVQRRLRLSEDQQTVVLRNECFSAADDRKSFLEKVNFNWQFALESYASMAIRDSSHKYYKYHYHRPIKQNPSASLNQSKEPYFYRLRSKNTNTSKIWMI